MDTDDDVQASNFTMRLPADLRAALERQAKDEDRTMTAVILRTLRENLNCGDSPSAKTMGDLAAGVMQAAIGNGPPPSEIAAVMLPTLPAEEVREIAARAERSSIQKGLEQAAAGQGVRHERGHFTKLADALDDCKHPKARVIKGQCQACGEKVA